MEAAAKDNYIRVIDESGEDYLYPENYFVFVEIPQEADRNVLIKTSASGQKSLLAE